MKIYNSVLPVMLLVMFAQSGFCASEESLGKHSAEVVIKKDVLPGSVPAYLNYVPFGLEDARSIRRQEFADSLHKAIRIGLDKSQAGSTQISILRLTSPTDIQAFRVLLTHRKNVTSTGAFDDTRLLFDADNGETQVFVDEYGTVSQGTQLWQLSPQDFSQLKQTLNRIYSAIPPPANWGMGAGGKTETTK